MSMGVVGALGRLVPLLLLCCSTLVVCESEQLCMPRCQTSSRLPRLLRLSGGQDESDSDEEEAMFARRPETTSSMSKMHEGMATAFGGQARGQGGPGLGGGGDPQGDNVLQLVNKTQTSLDKDKVFEGLRNLYIKRVKPLEEASWYSFFSKGATLEASDFDAKPIVLLLGQYSVGKTSFIRALLGKDFPGMRIGPEPTTDQFVAVMSGSDERVIPGHALSMQKDSPFHGLAEFGNAFLSRFCGATSTAPLLRNITLIDTPGVLSNKKHREGREYEFSSIIEWFASRADLIIVMFDAHKLDISDELQSILDKLRGHQDKIRILLNKVQQIDTQQLLRVYGALMWSLGEVLRTPEVPRVYMGSFWDEEEGTASSEWVNSNAHAMLLQREKADLVQELVALPQNTILRRVSSLVRRARSVKVHSFIVHYLRKQIAGWATVTVWNKAEKQKDLIDALDRNFVLAAQR
eukprot:181631-Hanusia_phi.AAC.1